MATYNIAIGPHAVNITANGISIISHLYADPETKTFQFVFGDGIDTARKAIVYTGSYPDWINEYLYDTTIVNEIDREDATFEDGIGRLSWTCTWTVPEALDGEKLNEIAIYDEDGIMIFYGFPVSEYDLVEGDIYNISLTYTLVSDNNEIRDSIVSAVLTNAGDPDPCIYIAYGDDDTANVGDETTLYSEVGRALATYAFESTYTMNDTVKLYINQDFDAATTIKEVGLFDAATVGNMAFRIVIDDDEQETYAANESGRIIVKLINRMGVAT